MGNSWIVKRIQRLLRFGYRLSRSRLRLVLLDTQSLREENSRHADRKVFPND
jgi:hypothetical protein